MAKVDPKNPNQVQEQGHAEEPQGDIQRRMEKDARQNPSEQPGSNESLDPVVDPTPNS